MSKVKTYRNLGRRKNLPRIERKNNSFKKPSIVYGNKVKAEVENVEKNFPYERVEYKLDFPFNLDGDVKLEEFNQPIRIGNDTTGISISKNQIEFNNDIKISSGTNIHFNGSGGKIENATLEACKFGHPNGFIVNSEGEVTKIGQDTPTDGQVLSWDNTNSKVVWDTPAQNSIDFDGDTGATVSINAGGTLTLAGGTGIESSGSGTTITHALSSGAALANLGGGSGSTFLRKDGTFTTPTNDDVSVANLDARLNQLTATMVTIGDATDVTIDFEGAIQIGQDAVFMTQPTVTTGAGVSTWSWTQGNKLDLTLASGSQTIIFDTGHPLGRCNLTLKLTQPASGAAGTVSSWSATGGGYNIKWAGGGSAPTLSTANGAIDILSFYFDGSTYYGVASLDFQ